VAFPSLVDNSQLLGIVLLGFLVEDQEAYWQNCADFGDTDIASLGTMMLGQLGSGRSIPREIERVADAIQEAGGSTPGIRLLVIDSDARGQRDTLVELGVD